MPSKEYGDLSIRPIVLLTKTAKKHINLHSPDGVTCSQYFEEQPDGSTESKTAEPAMVGSISANEFSKFNRTQNNIKMKTFHQPKMMKGL